MPTNDLAIRFTEEKYATKSEVAKDLKISSIDTFWSNIIAYRKVFYHPSPLKTIDNNTLVFCGCPSINGMVNALDNKLLRVNRNYSMLFAHPANVRCFNDESIANCLDYVSQKNNLNLDINLLRSIVRNDVQRIDDSSKPIVNYLNALRYVQKAHVNPIDVDYLAELYSALTGVEELTSFYRTKEDSAHSNQVLIDRVYTCAPVNVIEKMMNYLFSFIKTSSLSGSVKAATVYYYINYIRPFDTLSDEIATLMAKSILAHDSIGELAIYIPLESLLISDSASLMKIFTEVQKTADLTYISNYVAKVLNAGADKLLDLIANLNTAALKEDFYREESAPNPVNNVVEEAPIVQEKEVIEEANNVEEVKEEVNAVNPAPVNKPVGVSYVQEELAINYIPVALDEKQALLVEQDLLERDPSLKKGEAKFYARHCTKGKMYTIAQFKKAIGCVYETARTSMDHLAELGYYRKEKIKNKFVYVPIARN